jgi:hypothetical protein
MLAACAQGSPSQVSASSQGKRSVIQVASAPGIRPTYTLDTPVERIAADPLGKAVLIRDLPGLMSSKNYPLFSDMSLAQIASLSGGRLSQTKLSLVRQDLMQLSGANGEPGLPAQ